MTFAVGEQSKSIAIPIAPDTIDGPNETFSVVLTDIHGATRRTPPASPPSPHAHHRYWTPLAIVAGGDAACSH